MAGEKAPCLRCAAVAGVMNLPPDKVLCGDVTHELAKRMDFDRMRDLATRLTELANTFGGRGLGEAWIDAAERAGRSLLTVAARARETEAELDRRYGT